MDDDQPTPPPEPPPLPEPEGPTPMVEQTHGLDIEPDVMLGFQTMDIETRGD